MPRQRGTAPLVVRRKKKARNTWRRAGQRRTFQHERQLCPKVLEVQSRAPHTPCVLAENKALGTFLLLTRASFRLSLSWCRGPRRLFCCVVSSTTETAPPHDDDRSSCRRAPSSTGKPTSSARGGLTSREPHIILRWASELGGSILPEQDC